MARKLIVEIIADPTAYTAGLVKAGETTKAFATEMDRAGSSVKGFGRSLAVSAGGFLAVAGAADLLKTSIQAAQGAAVAQRSLATQMKTSGESFAANSAAIDKAGLSMAKFGYTSTDSEQALATLDRATGNVSKSIQIQGVAANIARARNISLNDKRRCCSGKPTTATRTAWKRLGIELPKGTKGWDAIYLAAQKFAGQAKANTTESERFQATLHDTEVIIGTALLPTINKLLDEFLGTGSRR